MRKRLLLTAAVLTFALAFAGCGSKDTANNETKAEATTQAQTEATTQAQTEKTTDGSFSATSASLEGYETFNNVAYKLGDDWNLYDNTSGTRLYTSPSINETFAMYVQNEVLYSKDDMVKAYETTVFSTYGDKYTKESKQIGSLNWNVYHFGADNLLNINACVDVYLYTDGKTTIYLENAWQAGASASGKIQDVLSSMKIK